MCGIIGYIGHKQAEDILLDGLQRLSYRGYDSAGIAVVGADGNIAVRKAKGKLEQLERLVERKPAAGFSGIGHTRWATHGEPNDVNAHPHTDVHGGIAVVHNGIIENHEELRKYLEGFGAVFVSQTDTEVIAHLLNHLYNGNMLETIMQAQKMLHGSYALGILCENEPDQLFCARHDSPLVMAHKNGESFLASDVPALLSHTRDVVFMQDGETGVVGRNGIEIFDVYGRKVERAVYHVEWNQTSAEKGGFAHYMLKEIHEQPTAMQKTFTPRGRLNEFSWLPWTHDTAMNISRITIAACGTAYHAGVFGKYVIEHLARIPVEAEIASEYRYRQPLVIDGEWFIAVSQSGETADTLAALKEARKQGANILAVCNAVGSSIAREAGEKNTLYTYAGPEIAVASTKAYITQAELLLITAAALGVMRKKLSEEKAEQIYRALEELPAKASDTLALHSQIQRIASRMTNCKHVFFTGRGLDYALSMEAALKLKEVSYIFSEAYAAGELKHGPIALLEKGRVVVASVTQLRTADKMLANLQEVRARGAYVLAICPVSLETKLRQHANEVIVIPDTNEWLAPLLAAIPLQLLAYCVAVARGCDVDQPRNLAKSVTVE